MTIWDEEADLLVFGSGAGGLAAALSGAIEGLDVILFEKTNLFGGTTSTSGGGIWIANPSAAHKEGIEDSVDKARVYLQGELGNHYRADLADAFLHYGAEALDYFAANSAVEFTLVPIPDYHADEPGGVAYGRTLVAAPFDGRKLGRLFERLRPPIPRLMILGGMMIGRDEIMKLLKPFSSWATFSLGAGLLLRYARDRISHSRGTRLLIGNAMVARFLYSLQQRGVKMRTGSPVVDLIREDGRVTGAIVVQAGVERRVRARCGVVLATGGPAHDLAARAAHMGAFPHSCSMVFAGDTGDGFRLAQSVGGQVDEDVSTPGVWSPASKHTERDGSTSLFPYGYLDRGKPGAIAINEAGNRFCNESNSYQDVVVAMFANREHQGPIQGHLIFDANFLWKYGAGIVPPHTRRPSRWVVNGYLTSAETIAALADKLGVPSSGLKRTVERHNEFARTGTDADFHKGETIFNRFNGDPAQQPNPCLAAIEKAPYYALTIHPTTLAMSLGLQTNGDAQVLDASGQPIEGLYACGNEMGSVMRGYCPGAGATLGPAITFGYIAARRATKH